MTHVLGGPYALLFAGLEIPDLNPQLGERGTDLLGRWDPRRRAKRQPDDLANPKAEREPSQRRRREGATENDESQCGRRSEPDGQQANPADELRAGNDQDRWAQTFDYHRLPVDVAMSVVEAVRASTTAVTP